MVFLGSYAYACFSSLSTRRFDGLHLLSFACQRDPYWGRSAMFCHPICLLPWLAWTFFHPLLFIFKGCILTPWMFAFTGFWSGYLIEGSARGLRSVLESPLNFCMSPKLSEGLLVLEGLLNFIVISSVFGGGSKVVRNFSLPVPSTWADEFLFRGWTYVEKYMCCSFSWKSDAFIFTSQRFYLYKPTTRDNNLFL